MDQRQKDLVSSMKAELADSVRATEFAEYLQLYKLVDNDEVDDIMRTVDSNFVRNLRLLEAAQECDSPTAFDDFVKVLERVDPPNATKLSLSLSSLSNNGRDGKTTGSRGIFGQLFDKFTKSPNGNYPMGMKSSISSSNSSPSYRSTGDSSNNYSRNNCAQTTSSPFKERHQATLIYNASSSTDRSQQEIQEQLLQHQQPSTTDNGYRLALRYPNGQLPVTPPTVSQSSRAVNEGDRISLRNINKFSQTPTRPPELALINNLSLTEEDEEEPVVCWHPYAHQESASGASSPHRCLPSYSSASSESGESSSDSLIIDPNLILDSNVMSAIAREGPNMMSVKMAIQCHNNCEEDYKMTARPRGMCLIVNNINFEDDIFPTRKGSDEDANRFDHIFKQLGFETIISRNLTADQMRDKFKELSAACRAEHDALFVFILSHGSEHGIYGTDGLEVYLDSEIISCFDNRNCKAMIGKPKVFVIQACRGRSKDCGGDGDTTDSIAWAPVTPASEARSASQENRVPASWLPSNQPSDGKRRKHPIRTDMLLVFSCLAGFVSVRNETAGSWLGVALAYFIMTQAHERDLLRILNLVTSDIIQRESSNGHIQSIELKLLGWTKNLYFNPGIYL